MIAVRYLPALATTAAFTLAAALLRPPPPQATLQRSIFVDFPTSPLAAALDDVRRDLLGCFAEYEERVPGDVDMRLALSITGGVEARARTLSGPPSPSMSMCVEDALSRVEAPAGENLEADVWLRWRTQTLAIEGAVRTRVAQPAACELPPRRTVPSARAKLAELKQQQAELRRKLAAMRCHAHHCRIPAADRHVRGLLGLPDASVPGDGAARALGRPR